MVINRYCGSGLEAIAIASTRIHVDCRLYHRGWNRIDEPRSVKVTKPRSTTNWRQNTPDYYTPMGLTAEQVAGKLALVATSKMFLLCAHTSEPLQH